MEVHAHTHTERKKFTHYLWEFLMLFLAVFCGFLAENWRENIVEKGRAEQYAKTLYEDIKVDTATLQKAIQTNNFITARIDSFRFLVQHRPIQSLPSGTWYYFGRFGTRDIELTFQDATLEQLINSGGLRYFKNFKVANSIAWYDKACKDLRYWTTSQLTFDNQLLSLRNRIFNSWYMDDIWNLTISDSKVDSFKQSVFPLLSTNEDDFIQYANFCQVRSGNYKFIQGKNQDVLKEAVALLALLKKEYHLK